MKASETKEIKLHSQKLAKHIEHVTKMPIVLAQIVAEYLALIQWSSLSKEQAEQKRQRKDFSNCIFTSADLGDHSLRSSFRGANLLGADLRRVKLSLSNLPFVLNFPTVLLSDAKDIKMAEYINILRSYIAAPISWFSKSREHGKYRAKVLLLELIQTQKADNPTMQHFLQKGLLPEEKETWSDRFFQAPSSSNPASNSLLSQLKKASKEALKPSASAEYPGRKP